jgi:hypothetical protein
MSFLPVPKQKDDRLGPNLNARPRKGPVVNTEIDLRPAVQSILSVVLCRLSWLGKLQLLTNKTCCLNSATGGLTLRQRDHS